MRSSTLALLSDFPKKTVEAVGIQEVAVRRVLRIDMGITRTTRVGRPDKSPVEPGLKDILRPEVVGPIFDEINAKYGIDAEPLFK